jgi:hypothetical protein
MSNSIRNASAAFGGSRGTTAVLSLFSFEGLERISKLCSLIGIVEGGFFLMKKPLGANRSGHSNSKSAIKPRSFIMPLRGG